jgi:poly [ADP-ribose] polymerase 2/3/4
MQMMKEQMIEIGYDAGKMPLGKLSKDTIKRGYGVLKKLSDVITGKKKGDLYDLSSEFFTIIPHDFGFK